MFKLICKRILALIPVALGVITVVCLLIHAVPGDPLDTLLGDYAGAEEKDALRKQLGLDQPALFQLYHYIARLLHGDLGRSLIYNRPVAELILERMPATLELAVCSLIIAILISLPLGILSALNKNKPLDYVAMGFALSGVAIPHFWLGPMLILLFSIYLGWLPVSERTDLSSYILPSITLGTALAAILSRMTRNSVLDTMKEDYVRTARAKGARESSVLLKHVLRNAALPLVTIVGLQFGVLLTGAVVTEKIFDWPGLGTLILDGLGNRDYPLVQGCVLVFSMSYLIVNLLTDLAYRAFDPRISWDE
ncbi:MAG: ABC transporter permease [Oligoflexales bacterium]|nr:ABC transporter permease [Oligoflexales bacterium]